LPKGVDGEYVACSRSKVVLLEEVMTGGGRGDKRTWRRLTVGSAKRKAHYGCNWRQQADGGRRTGRDDSHKVA
jgi:hypothetical protein